MFPCQDSNPWTPAHELNTVNTGSGQTLDFWEVMVSLKTSCGHCVSYKFARFWATTTQGIYQYWWVKQFAHKYLPETSKETKMPNIFWTGLRDCSRDVFGNNPEWGHGRDDGKSKLAKQKFGRKSKPTNLCSRGPSPRHKRPRVQRSWSVAGSASCYAAGGRWTHPWPRWAGCGRGLGWNLGCSHLG